MNMLTLVQIGRAAVGPPQKNGSLWLRVKPIVRDFAQQSKKSLPRDSAPNRSLIDRVSIVNTFRATHKRSTIFVKDLLHRTEGATVSRVIRRSQPTVYRIWLKSMTDTYPTYAYLKRVELAKSRNCPYCAAGVPETLTHFACVCPQFRDARTSAHNQVRQVISSFLFRHVGPTWIVHEETRMGNTGLHLTKVPVDIVVSAGKSSVADSAGECDLQRWQPDWLAISQTHKRIAIIDLCRPSDVHEDQLEIAATLKQNGYRPLICALDSYAKQGWVIHVFPWVVGIRGLLHPPHICALLQFLEVPRQYWLPAMEGTALASVRAFYFLHRVRFGGRPEGGLLDTGHGHTSREDASDSSETDEPRPVRTRCKRGSSPSPNNGAIRHREWGRSGGPHSPYEYPRRGQTTTEVDPVTVGVTDDSTGMGGSCGVRLNSRRVSWRHGRQARPTRDAISPPTVHHLNSRRRAKTQTYRQCTQAVRNRQGNRLRLPRANINGIYDINDQRSYVSLGRRQRGMTEMEEVWGRWRAVEVKKRRRT